MCFLATIASWVLWGYFWLVFAAVILSWINPDPLHPVVRTIHRLTDPAFQKVRRLLKTEAGGLDFSPMIVGFAILLIRYVVVYGLRQLGHC